MTRPLGFTGTQDGCTLAQTIALATLFETLRPTELHQGCCIGADEHAVAVFNDYRCASKFAGHLRIIGYPSNLTGYVSARTLALCNEIKSVKPPLDRNHDVVDATRKLVACPKGPEELRSGTWATIRYARKLGRHIYIIWRDGTVTQENAPPEPATSSS